jgi:4-amino-4-deoxy-L-arabinose transferase-like glycosyltransferase
VSTLRSYRTPAALFGVALVHAGLYIVYQRPDWYAHWTDQAGYRRLGEVLAATGRFTRYTDTPAYVPEVLRTPGYPAFVATMYRLFGTSQMAVVVPQAIVFGMLCLVVYGLTRRIAPERVAIAAGFCAALYPPFPYFGALVLTELWTTFLLTIAMWFVIRAVQRRTTADLVWSGVVLACTALTRPVFVLLPFALTGVAMIASWPDVRRMARWLVLPAAAALTLLPWFGYTYHYFHKVTISPAGGIGRGTWEGTWQGVWPGRVQAELTDIADRDADRGALDRDVTAVALRSGLAAGPMLEYTHQWQDIRRIWTTPVDPAERARARVDADQEYWRVGVQNITSAPAAWLRRRLTRGLFSLWATDIPVRYSTINQLPPGAIYAMWGVQTILIALAIGGVMVLAASGRVTEAALFTTVLVYVSAVHFPLLTEVRQSLPAKPLVIVLAVVGALAAPWRHRRQHDVPRMQAS